MQALINRLKNLQSLSVEEILNKQETREFIITLNQSQIFIDGERVDGFNIGTYKRYTEGVNEGRTFTFGGVSKTKTAGSNIFLVDSGFFFRSFRVVVGNGTFKIIADDSTGKDNPLTDTYGEILGLSPESMQKLIDYCHELLLKEARVRISA